MTNFHDRYVLPWLIGGPGSNRGSATRAPSLSLSMGPKCSDSRRLPATRLGDVPR
jgi:hypothetical protein